MKIARQSPLETNDLANRRDKFTRDTAFYDLMQDDIQAIVDSLYLSDPVILKKIYSDMSDISYRMSNSVVTKGGSPLFAVLDMLTSELRRKYKHIGEGRK